MGVVKLAIGDALITSLWVFSISTLGPFTSLISSYLQVQPPLTLFVTTTLVFILLFLFTTVGQILGGANFNPTATASFYAAGYGRDSLFSMAIRFPAQAIGAVGGALAIKEFMPAKYKHMLGGPSVKVDLHTGAIAEGVLTFVISFIVLFVLMRGPKSKFLKLWLLAATTVTLVVNGSKYTGPAMNPANAYGWAYVRNRHNTWEQFYVYWICPLIGSVTAALFFRLFFSPPKPKEKKA
ncbi:aquaporin SIP1-2 isoform X1 [Nymphaea colorata]|nr:aquaporin SIP1-2 isoform X1 [Nymphaea colorata]